MLYCGGAIIGFALFADKESSRAWFYLVPCAVANNLFLSNSQKRGIHRNDVIANGVLWAGAISESAILTTKNLLALLILLIILALASTILLIRKKKLQIR